MNQPKNLFTVSERYETPAARLSFVMRAAGLVPTELARMIHDRYPQISFEWLVSGKAEQEPIQMR